MSPKYWTESEIKTLCKMYPHHSINEISTTLKRSEQSVKDKASRLRLTSTEDRKDFVRKQRTRSILQACGFKIWTREEDNKLRMQYPRTSTRKLAQILGRSVCSIRNRADLLKLRKDMSFAEQYTGNETAFSGAEGERMAEIFLKKKQWKILKRGKNNSPFDFIVETQDGEKYAINVKHGSWGFAVDKSNLLRLSAIEAIPAILFVFNNKKAFFMPINSFTVE